MKNSDADSGDFDELGLGSLCNTSYCSRSIDYNTQPQQERAHAAVFTPSLEAHGENTYEIIVVDNGSKPEELSKLADTPGCLNSFAFR